MNPENKSATGAANADVMARLHLSTHSLAVVRACGPIRFRCLAGSVWITQEGDRNDVVLSRGYQWVAKRSKRVYLSSLNGARLSISDALPLPARRAGLRSRPRTLCLDITRGTYTLSGGHAESGNNASIVPNKRDEQSIVVSSARDK